MRARKENQGKRISNCILDSRRLPEFEHDLKRLGKRFRTLEEDLATLLKAQ